ncbi:hypothetical protein [Streptomyces gobiensis]|uniref:hypothetical protein n=1 Tax=Streptomyces gobiensis TaxID=2875706 RepID=UPI001E4017F6|nr:hypothetical protein [Streptomyces gobiensis]UGY93949.1 hypothetical protein test1122_21005 [Streptomyces gobiensis]
MKDERQAQEENLMEDLDDLGQARSVRRSLEQLTKNPAVDDRLQQMARELLSGRAGLRDVMNNPSYMSALGEGLTRIKEAADRMTPEEEERARAEAERFFEKQQEEADREDAEREQAEREARENGPRPRHRGGR